MDRTLSVLVGIAAIVGGTMLFSIYIGDFTKHYQIQAHPVGVVGFISEVTIVGRNTDIHYYFNEPMIPKRYAGSNVFPGIQYSYLPVGAPTPIQYMEGHPEINRHQLAREQIYTLGRNVTIGVFLVVLGLAMLAGGLRSSDTDQELVEAES